jgi:NAD-dependent dihydropyrimidine dehydrogenase PreA subunit
LEAVCKGWRLAVTYVITEPCIDVKDKSCIEECPVDCIYEGDRAPRRSGRPGRPRGQGLAGACALLARAWNGERVR